jgi:hypothetical protein
MAEAEPITVVVMISIEKTIAISHPHRSHLAAALNRSGTGTRAP